MIRKKGKREKGFGVDGIFEDVKAMVGKIWTDMSQKSACISVQKFTGKTTVIIIITISLDKFNVKSNE